jgi:hypothetical protein
MGAHIEWICQDVGALRAGRNFKTIETHDDYEISCTVVVRGEVAIFKAACGHMPTLVRERELIRKQLPEYVKYVTFDRVTKDGMKTIVIDVEKWDSRRIKQ